MASWKKIIVSGSAAHLTAVTASNLTNDNILVAGASGEVQSSGITYDGTTFDAGSAIIRTTGAMSASQFSGSFFGDGSALTGLATTLRVAADDLSTTNINQVQDGILFSTASNQGFGFTTGSVVTIGATDYYAINLEAPQDLKTSANVSFNRVTIAGIGSLAQSATDDALVIDAGSGLVLPQISSSIEPIANVGFNIGSSSNKWNNIYAGRLLNSVLVETNEVSSSAGLTLTAPELTGTISTGDVTFNLSGGSSQFLIDGATLVANGGASVGGDLTVSGDLFVNGTTTNINTTNLDVEDAFILLNSGSAAGGDSGIIFGGSEAAVQSGSLLFWDASYNSNDGRLAIKGRVASSATGNQTPDYHIAGVYEGSAANAASAEADHAGNIRIEGDEIFIYV
jgi:hypothetical protein